MGSSASWRSRWRSPERRGSSCSTSRRRGCRRPSAAELIEILSALPAHIGYIIIEHDMDVALRVVESVTMMHNGRIFKEGTPQEIESDPEVQELYLGGGGMAEPRRCRRRRQCCRSRASTSTTGVARAAGRRPRRSSTAFSPSSAATAWARRRSARRSWGSSRRRAARCEVRGEDLARPFAGGDRASRRRLCAAGAPAVALADRRRASAHDRRRAEGPVDRRARLRRLSAPGGAQDQQRRPAVGRRAADAGDRARPRDQPASPDHGRADGRAGAGHRRPGRGDAGPPRLGKRHGRSGHRAEHRRRDLGVRERGDHGQRADQPHHRVAPPRRGPRAPAAPARRRPPFGRAAGGRGAVGRRAGGGGAPAVAPPRRRAGENLRLESRPADALVAARPERPDRSGRAHGLGRREPDDGGGCPSGGRRRSSRMRGRRRSSSSARSTPRGRSCASSAT